MENDTARGWFRPVIPVRILTRFFEVGDIQHHLHDLITGHDHD